jgi:protein-disulfide isomerase
MRCAPPLVLAAVLPALASLGASCNGDDGDDQVTEVTPNGAGDEHPIESIDGVDTSDLTRSERRTWQSIVNDQLSPCGQPVSVARCATQGSDCRRCVPAARYLVRLVTEGLDRAEIEKNFHSRYGSDTAVDIPLGDAPFRGAAMAPVTIVEFSDFECPYCGAAAPEIKRVLRELEGQVRVVFHHYPLDLHVNAMPAARAAVAAGNQGKFWEMHDLLFEHQEELETEDLDHYAEQLGLDMERFHADVQSEETQRLIDADKALGRELEVRSTPTIFVNGRRFEEQPRSLLPYLREELASQ